MKLSTVIAITALALLASCAKQQTETEKKIAEMEQQLKLAEMEKKLAEARGQAPGTPSPDDPAAPAPGASGSGKAPSQVATNTKNIEKNAETIVANRKDIDRNAENIAANRKDIDANKQAIATNKDAIATNAANIEKNRQGVEEAKRMAAAPPTHTIPAGTPIKIQTTSKIRSDRSSTGALFEATLAEPIEVDGYVVAERGAQVEGVVVESDPGGRVKGLASITIAARSVMMADGRRLPIKTSSRTYEARSSAGKDAAKVGIASGVGAAIGAIAGGGKGAAIGAGAGAAGGTGLVLGTRGNHAEVPSESTITLTLTAPVQVQEQKR
jgi:hypothetical protein